jgi:YD repeat-containing protein
MFDDAGGGKHALYLSAWFPGGQVPICQEMTPPPVLALYSGDTQVFATLPTPTYQSQAPYLVPVTVWDADGTTYSFSSESLFFGSWTTALPATVEDRNGNLLTYSGQSNGAISVVDTAGRTVISTSGFGASGNTISIAGVNNPYTLYWESTPAGTYNSGAVFLPWGDSNPCGPAWPTANTQTTSVSNIVLPNGQQYTFYYDSGSGFINKIVYPTGGWVQYTWQQNTASEVGMLTDSGNNPQSCYYHYGLPAIVKRQVSFDGSTVAEEQDFSYTTNWSNDTQWTTKTTTVTTKDLVRGGSFQTTYTYSGYYLQVPPNIWAAVGAEVPLESQIVYGDWNGSTRKTVNKTWANQYELTSVQTIVGTNGPSSRVTYKYGNWLAQVIEKDEYDFGQSSPSRQTITNYQTQPTAMGSTINDRPCQVIVYDSTKTRVAETDFYYDGGTSLCATENQAFSATASVSGLPPGTHDEVNYAHSSLTPRGNVTQEIRWLNGGTSPTTTYAYDETGQVLSSTDACGNTSCSDMTGASHTATYSYNDAYTVLSGSQNTSYTPSNGNTNAMLTEIVDPLGHTEMFTYDYNNGQLTSSRDQNDINANRAGTAYIYNDPFARPTQVNYPDGGQTTYSYNDSSFSASANTPSVTKTVKLSSTVSETTTTARDGVGHVVRTILSSDPDSSSGNDYTDTSYDGSGRVLQQSNPYRPGSSNPTDGTASYTYDALGRTTWVQRQDGSVVQTVYDQASTNTSGVCTTVIDEAGNPRKTCTDGLGRLIEVDEPGTGATPGTADTGTVTITGGPDQVTTITYTYPCGYEGSSTCTGTTTIPDGGTVNVSVNGFTASGGFGPGSTTQSIASQIVTALNSSSSPVTASLSGSTITINSKSLGTAYDLFSLSVTVSWNSQYFSSPSFGGTTSGPTLMPNSNLGTPLVTLYNYDVLGNLLCVWQKGTDTTSATFSYNSSANTSNCLSAAPAAWRPRSFTYDSLSRLISATNPESGTISYQYDANGNLQSKTAPMPNKIPADTSLPQTATSNYNYDVTNRLLQKSYFDNTSSGPVADPNTPIAQYAYDGNTIVSGCPVAYPPALPDSNPIYHRTAMCDGSGATSWAYDITGGTGWKTTEERTIAGVTEPPITSQNNFGGMLYQLTYPSGRTVTYTPTGAGRYASAIDSGSQITYAQNAVYAPPGGLTSLNNSGSNILVTNTYNSRLQPGTLQASSGSGLVLDLIYNFHLGQGDNGNVFGIANNRDNSRNQTYTYDMLNRIVTGQDQETSDGWCWGYNYAVDNWGTAPMRLPRSARASACTRQRMARARIKSPAPATTWQATIWDGTAARVCRIRQPTPTTPRTASSRRLG